MTQLDRQKLSVPDDLLRTKLAPPRLHAALVSRARLYDLLDEGATRILTLVSAPAGSGKTTLLAAWIAAQRNSAAWVSLDPGDNEPIRFWRYVLTACASFGAGVGASALAAFRMSQQPHLENMLTLFINELAQLPGLHTLVIDDYHLITSPEIQHTLTFFLDHLPNNLHVILISRTEPPLPLARFRARNELIEITAADLRFLPVEIAAMLGPTLHSTPSPEVLEQLAQRTEGWATGLRLMSLALQARPGSAEQLLTTFGGGHRHVMEYLVSEVLAGQPESVQTFLLETSFLPRLTASLCDAVTGRTDSAAVLEQLERENLFVVPLDSSSPQAWYRYHALFAEAMQRYAQQTMSEASLLTLRANASRWYQHHGLFVEAVEDALTGHEYERAVSLIERLYDQRSFNELYTLRRWVESIPREVVEQHALLSFAYASALLFTSDRFSPASVPPVETWWDVAEKLWRSEDNRPRLGQLTAMQGVLALWQGNFPRSFVLSHQALDLLDENDGDLRGVCLLNIGFEQLLAGKTDSAQQMLIEARALCEASQNIHATLAVSGMLGTVCYQQAELDQAAYYFQLVRDNAVGGEEMLDDQSQALCGLSSVAYEQNLLPLAEQHAAQALDYSLQRHEELHQVEAALLLARIEQAQGQGLQARHRLQLLEAELRLPALIRQVQGWQARLAVAAGDTESVQHWYATVVEPQDKPLPTQQEFEALVIARLHLLNGDANAALDILKGWRADAHAEGRTRSEIEILCLMALSYNALAQVDQAEETLTRALNLGHSKGMQRIFLDEGKPLAMLLQVAAPRLTRRTLAAYAATLLRGFAPGQSSASQLADLPEALSPQELRVLRLIVAGLANAEIAQELVVSANTVKTHVRNIYRKLNVSTRDEVQEAARELNLL